MVLEKNVGVNMFSNSDRYLTNLDHTPFFLHTDGLGYYFRLICTRIGHVCIKT